MKPMVFFIATILSIVPAAATTYTLTPQTSNGTADADNGVLLLNPSSTRIGTQSSTPGYGSAGIFVFALPKLAYGTQVTSASLAIQMTGSQYAPSFNMDLYSLGISESSAILGSDYFNGAYGSAPNATPIMENFATPSTPAGWLSPTGTWNSNLVDDLNSYLSTGATLNDYYFLRVNMNTVGAPADVDAGYWFDFTASGTTTQPQLSITTATPPQFGRVMIEYWTAISNGQELSDLTGLTTYGNDQPSSREEATVMSLPSSPSPAGFVTNWGTGASGARIIGVFYPTTTGTYTFQLTSNAASALYFGTSTSSVLGSSPNVIVSIPGKNSQPVTSANQSLTAGTPYYIAAVEKTGPLDSNPCPTLSISYTTPTDGTMTPMPTTNVASFDPGTTYVSGTNQVSKTLTQGQTYNGVTDPLRGHPRLMISPAALERLYAATQVSGTPQTWYGYLVAQANADIAAGPVQPRTGQGNTGNFLIQARAMTNQVATLALVYNLTTNSTLQASCLNGITAQLSQVAAWKYPYSGSPPNPLPWGSTTDSNTQMLSVVEIAQAYAIAYDWCYSGLTATQKTNYISNIQSFAFVPARQSYYDYGHSSGSLGSTDAWWVNTSNNWTIVCNSGLVFAALAILDDEPTSGAATPPVPGNEPVVEPTALTLYNQMAPTVLDNFFPNINNSSNIAMEELGPDGGWGESHAYWQFINRYLADMMASLETSAGTQYTFDTLPGLSSTGIQGIYDAAPDQDIFPFGDAGSNALTSAPSQEYFGLKYNQPVFSWSEVRNLVKYWNGGAAAEITPLDLVWYDPRSGTGAMTDANSPQSLNLPLAYYLSNSQLAYLRSGWQDNGSIYVGVKAGPNSLGHALLQSGAFYLDAQGTTWIAMLGGGQPSNYSYGSTNDNYFDSNPYDVGNHWEFYNARAEGNNTLVVNPGPDGGQSVNDGATNSFPFVNMATITSLSSGPSTLNASTPEQKVIVDMTKAYNWTDGNPWSSTTVKNANGQATTVTSAKRGFRIVNQQNPPNWLAEGTVQEQDEVTTGANAVINWGVQTGYHVTLTNNGTAAIITTPQTNNGSVAFCMQIQSPAGAKFTSTVAQNTSNTCTLQQPISPPESGYPPAQANEYGYTKVWTSYTNSAGGPATVTVSMSPYYLGNTPPTNNVPPVTPLSNW
jgi:hypothetical protein